jgi:hypothetical protein
MLVQYLGDTIGVLTLTHGRIYRCAGVVVVNNIVCLKIIDDSKEDYLYTVKAQEPHDSGFTGIQWKIVADPDGVLAKAFADA